MACINPSFSQVRFHPSSSPGNEETREEANWVLMSPATTGGGCLVYYPGGYFGDEGPVLSLKKE